MHSAAVCFASARFVCLLACMSCSTDLSDASAAAAAFAAVVALPTGRGVHFALVAAKTKMNSGARPTRNRHDTTTWFSSGFCCRFSRRSRCPAVGASPDSCSASTIC